MFQSIIDEGRNLKNNTQHDKIDTPYNDFLRFKKCYNKSVKIIVL